MYSRHEVRVGFELSLFLSSLRQFEATSSLSCFPLHHHLNKMNLLYAIIAAAVAVSLAGECLYPHVPVHQILY
jgi:hypothetical protein